MKKTMMLLALFLGVTLFVISGAYGAGGGGHGGGGSGTGSSAGGGKGGNSGSGSSGVGTGSGSGSSGTGSSAGAGSGTGSGSSGTGSSAGAGSGTGSGTGNVTASGSGSSIGSGSGDSARGGSRSTAGAGTSSAEITTPTEIGDGTRVAKRGTTGPASSGVINAPSTESEADTAVANHGASGLAGSGAGSGVATGVQMAPREESIRSFDHQGVKGEVFLGEATIAPLVLSPGDKLTRTLPFTVSAPRKDATLKVRETVSMSGEGLVVELSRRESERPQGTHTSTLQFVIPKDLPRGTYTLTTVITANGMEKSTLSRFVVGGG
jgi:hypothetical protein